MLILNRKVGESIVIDDKVEVTILESVDGKIKLGIEAPKEVVILRKEVYEEVKAENTVASDISMEQFNNLNKK